MINELTKLSLDKPIPERWFNECWDSSNLDYFDRDGFEITALEDLYCHASGYNCKRFALDHQVICDKWFTSFPDERVHIDHSFIAVRFGFSGEARQQLINYIHKDLRIMKLLNIKGKIGLDVSLDILTPQYYGELVHIERDFYNVSDAEAFKQQVELTLNVYTDWDEAIEKVVTLQPILKTLPADDQSDIKARLFGFDRTYDTLKPIN